MLTRLGAKSILARADVNDATEARRQAVQHRDALIAAARAAGIPWTAIQTTAGTASSSAASSAVRALMDGGDWGAAYARRVMEARGRQADFQADHNGLYIGGQVAGSMLPFVSAGLGARGALALAGRGIVGKQAGVAAAKADPAAEIDLWAGVPPISPEAEDVTALLKPVDGPKPPPSWRACAARAGASAWPTGRPRASSASSSG